MADRYCEGDIVITLHVGVRRHDSEPCQFSAIYQVSNIPREISDETGMTNNLKIPMLLPVDSYIQEPVLVSVVKVADEAEQGREEIVRSIVRLYALKNCPHCITQETEMPQLFGEPFGSIADEELKFPSTGRRVGAGFLDGNPINEVIESRPQIMNAIAAEERPSVTRCRRCVCEVNNETMLVSLQVSLAVNRVRVAIVPSADFFCDEFGVFLCMPDLKPTGC